MAVFRYRGRVITAEDILYIRELIAADMSRARRAAVIDQHAATFILQGALDRLRHLDAAGTSG